MIITSVRLHPFIPVLMTLTLLHGHRGVRKMNLLMAFCFLLSLELVLYMIVRYMGEIRKIHAQMSSSEFAVF